jgi:hypothetical protein
MAGHQEAMASGVHSSESSNGADSVRDAFRAAATAREYELAGNVREAAREYDVAVSSLQEALAVNSMALPSEKSATVKEQIRHFEEKRLQLMESFADQQEKADKHEREREQKFCQTLDEFFQSETRYNEDLRVMEYYQEAVAQSLNRLGPQVISLADMDTVFGHLDSVIAHSDSLLSGLESSNSTVHSIGKMVQQTQHIELSMQDLGRMGAQYLGGDVHDVIHKLENENRAFRALVDRVREERGVQSLSWYTIMPVSGPYTTDVQSRATLTCLHSMHTHKCSQPLTISGALLFLLCQVQRAMRYRLLLQDLLKHSPKSEGSDLRLSSVQRSLAYVHRAIMLGEGVRDRSACNLPRVHGILVRAKPPPPSCSLRASASKTARHTRKARVALCPMAMVHNACPFQARTVAAPRPHQRAAAQAGHLLPGFSRQNLQPPPALAGGWPTSGDKEHQHWARL